jgi:hypothetical protein
MPSLPRVILLTLFSSNKPPKEPHPATTPEAVTTCVHVGIPQNEQSELVSQMEQYWFGTTHTECEMPRRQRASGAAYVAPVTFAQTTRLPSEATSSSERPERVRKATGSMGAQSLHDRVQQPHGPASMAVNTLSKKQTVRDPFVNFCVLLFALSTRINRRCVILL